MAAVGKFEGPKTQNKWPGIGAVDKITAFKAPNHKMETLAFFLTARVIFRRGSFIRTVTLYLYLQIYNQKHSALQNRNSANNLQPASARPCKVPHRHPVGVGGWGGGYSLYSDDRDDRRIF